MPFKRLYAPHLKLESEDLTRALINIGINLSPSPCSLTQDKNKMIEETLFFASIEAMERDDLRVLSLLITWFCVHQKILLKSRLAFLASTASERVRCLWSALLGKKLYQGPRLSLLRIGTEFHLTKRGEDPRFKDTPLIVPAGIVRIRSTDVLSPSELARIHKTYYYRVMMGPTIRADMWAALEENPLLSPSELARQTHGAFATAWKVKKDWEILSLPKEKELEKKAA